MQRFAFIPELELEPDSAAEDVTVKGRRPSITYNFSLRDIYPLIPDLNPAQAYQKIADEFEHLDRLLCSDLKLRDHFLLPPIANDAQALTLLGILFDFSIDYVDGLWKRLSATESKSGIQLELSEARPYPLRLASPQKLIHTLSYIDTNIKVNVENLTKPYPVTSAAIRQIVESALKIYAYLIKQQDFQLARSMNFNYSMFLQDRILNLAFGDHIYRAANRSPKRGRLANHIALELLKNLGMVSYRQLCTLGVFMGCIWTYEEDFQRNYLAHPESISAQIVDRIDVKHAEWGIDYIDQFLGDVGKDAPGTIVVVLDDNGESVFDVALFQRLLKDNGHLNVAFVVNSYPVTENIDLKTFYTLIEDAYFTELRSYFAQERATLLIENQGFHSLELAYLNPQTYQAMQQSQFVYIKGASFFETFQPTDMMRYYCFTVYSPTSVALTGCGKGKGIFAKLHSGQDGYTYHSSEWIETLQDKVAEKTAKEGRL